MGGEFDGVAVTHGQKGCAGGRCVRGSLPPTGGLGAVPPPETFLLSQIAVGEPESRSVR